MLEMALQQLVAEAVDSFNALSCLLGLSKLWKDEYLSFIEGVGELFRSDEEQLRLLKQATSVDGAADSDFQSQSSSYEL